MDGPGNLKTFDEVCQALYTAYISSQRNELIRKEQELAGFKVEVLVFP
jgi:hypothetical protein